MALVASAKTVWLDEESFAIDLRRSPAGNEPGAFVLTDLDVTNDFVVLRLARNRADFRRVVEWIAEQIAARSSVLVDERGGGTHTRPYEDFIGAK
jgi:hypothetical protein